MCKDMPLHHAEARPVCLAQSFSGKGGVHRVVSRQEPAKGSPSGKAVGGGLAGVSGRGAGYPEGPAFLGSRK